MERGKENNKKNFNKLWSKVPKERDEFGTRKTTTTIATTTKTTEIIRIILNKKL